MLTQDSKYYSLKIISDLVLLNLCFAVSATLAQSFELFFTNNLLYLLLAILNLIWYFFDSNSSGDEFVLLQSYPERIFELVKGIVIQSVSAIVFIFTFKELLFTRNFVLYYSSLLFISLSVKVIILNKYYKYLFRKGSNFRNLLIVGTNEAAHKFYNNFIESGFINFRIIGFLDDQKNNVPSELYLGTPNLLQQLLQEKRINDVIIAIPNKEFDKLNDLIRICNISAVQVHIIPDYFQHLSKNYKLTAFDNIPIISLRTIPLEKINWKFLKRGFDIIFSISIIVIVFSWLFPIIILIHKILTKGKIFFIQDRVGKGDKVFRCFKFRTMVNNSTDEFNPTMLNDPRVTPFGKFLRKSNIDELPQFLNVLLGDMSVVGPRPHAVSFNKKYSEFVEEIRMRHTVKPGITGWAQIHGLRGDAAEEEKNKVRTRKRIQFDLWYIENWSFYLDIQIIFMTIFQMLKGKAQGR